MRDAGGGHDVAEPVARGPDHRVEPLGDLSRRRLVRVRVGPRGELVDLVADGDPEQVRGVGHRGRHLPDVVGERADHVRVGEHVAVVPRGEPARQEVELRQVALDGVNSHVQPGLAREVDDLADLAQCPRSQERPVRLHDRPEREDPHVVETETRDLGEVTRNRRVVQVEPGVEPPLGRGVVDVRVEVPGVGPGALETRELVRLETTRDIRLGEVRVGLVQVVEHARLRQRKREVGGKVDDVRQRVRGGLGEHLLGVPVARLVLERHLRARVGLLERRDDAVEVVLERRGEGPGLEGDRAGDLTVTAVGTTATRVARVAATRGKPEHEARSGDRGSAAHHPLASTDRLHHLKLLRLGILNAVLPPSDALQLRTRLALVGTWARRCARTQPDLSA